MKLLTVVVTTGLAISTFSFATENVTNAKVFQPLKPTILITLDKLKAFPTAEGAGANATGGRGGRVIYVKNRNASGEGSLKAALEATGPRTIVFATGGRFNVNRSINLGNYKTGAGANNFSNFTLAGQTANDKGGVHLARSNFSRCIGEYGETALNISRQDNMILRYFDSRYNWQLAVPPQHPPENHGCARGYVLTQNPVPTLRFIEPEDLIIDHISSGWSSYGLAILDSRVRLSNRGETDGISIQRSLMHEGIHVPSSLNWRFPNPTPSNPDRTSAIQHNHNVGMLLGFRGRRGFTDYAGTEEDWNKIGAFSIHKNAFIGISHRLPNTAGGDNARFRVINNYIYGFDGDGTGKRISRVGGNAHNDLVGNVYQQAGYSPDFTTKNLMGFRFDNFMPSPPSPEEHPNFYIHDNLFLDKQGERHSITDIVNSDARNMLYFRGDRNGTTGNRGANLNEKDHGLILRNNESEALDYPVNKIATTKVKTNILSNVGGNVRFRDDGSTYIDDAIDAKYISWAVNNAGPSFITRVPTDNGLGNTRNFIYPDYDASAKTVDLQAPDKDGIPYDSDEDGMPNRWEMEHLLDPDVKDNNGVRADRDWEFKYGDTTYLVRNNAGYTNLEMYLADIAGDFHMLAKTEGKPINGNNNDEIKSIDILNPIIIPATTAEAFIGYSATEKRDVKCFLKNAATNKLIAFDKSVVNAGSGMTVCDLDIPANTPGGNNYLLYTYMTKANGKWSERVAEETKTQIQVMALTDDLVSINIPSTVNAGKSVSAYINYSAKADRQMKCSLRNKSTGNYVGFDSVSVSAGIGKVEEMDGQVTAQGSAAVCNFDLPANTPQGDYTLGIYMTKPNGKWSERFDLIMTSIKIEK